VVVEFVVAIMPLLITFFALLQLEQIVIAHLMVKHATIIGARAAAVLTNEHNNTPDQPPGNKNEDLIQKAVQAGLGLWDSYDKVKSIKLDDTNGNKGILDESTCQDPYQPVTVSVIAEFNCRVPLGRIICGSGTHIIKQKYSFPHQGARYQTDDNNGGGGARCN